MTLDLPYTLFPLGDTAITLDFGNRVDEGINRRVLALYRQLKRALLPGVRDVVPAYSSLTVHYDPQLLLPAGETEVSAFEVAAAWITEIITTPREEEVSPPRLVRIPVCYAPAFAPDLQQLAEDRDLSVEEAIGLHTAPTYRVFLVGFLPGFPYLGTVDERIAAPRRAEPRPLVAAGSVGIAGRQTGIYPLASPGGWQIIGRTPLRLFDPKSDPPVLLQPGDEVQFYPITEHEFAHY